MPNFIPRTEAIAIGDITYSWNKLSALVITVPVLILLTLVRPLDAAGQGDARRRAGH